ncbi:MAG: FAD-dependent oxidoreductase [Phycisphaerae bacterium]|nr:FAD-dependent oxidoreductase [Phycisphaerae bacterium]
MSDSACEACSVLTDAQAKMEASRCLMCDDPPCVKACPAAVPVKHFIRAIRFDSPRRAINLIRDRNVFAGVCGLACPVEELCVGACTSTELSTPIAIGRLQHYAAVKELESGRGRVAVVGGGRSGTTSGRRGLSEDCGSEAKAGVRHRRDARAAGGRATGSKVAVIGGGPSGLAAAAELARLGHKPTVFEKRRRLGGICTYAVPGHRLPQELVASEIECIESLGVEIKTSVAFGRGQTVDDLFAAGYTAVYVSTGLQEAATPRVPGEGLEGVTTWKALLEGFAASRLGEGDEPPMTRDVIVVGGGSVAMDVAGVARQLGAEEIDIVCLEAPNEMPADERELHEVWDEGVRFHTRSMPLEITGQSGRVTGLRAVRIRWKEPDKFVPSNAEQIEGTEYWLPGSMVVFAIGARPSAGLNEALPGVEFDHAGRIVVDAETGATSREGVYAGGDAVSGGGATIVKAVAEGKRAGAAMAAYLVKRPS